MIYILRSKNGHKNRFWKLIYTYIGHNIMIRSELYQVSLWIRTYNENGII